MAGIAGHSALRSYRRALALDPLSAPLRFNIANTLRDLKRFGDAVLAYNQVLEVAPGFAMAHHNKATCLLQLGQLVDGFREYEWRKVCPGWEDDQRYKMERPWRGEDLAGKTLYIYPELFQGDLLQFGRYALFAHMVGARVILAAPPSMHAILRTMHPAIEVVSDEAPAPPYDYQCALMSLPTMFGTELKTVPKGPRYLHADPARVARWRDRIGSDGVKVGIAWQGSVRANLRSFPLALAAEQLSAVKGVRLISLQKHAGLEQLAALPPGVVQDLGEDFDPGPDAFVDTAAALMCCDLFVTTDTSVAHLAGALGVPTWIALPYVGDWRWLDRRTDSPWYPTVRLFRQAKRNEWEPVFVNMAQALRSTKRA